MGMATGKGRLSAPAIQLHVQRGAAESRHFEIAASASDQTPSHQRVSGEACDPRFSRVRTAGDAKKQKAFGHRQSFESGNLGRANHGVDYLSAISPATPERRKGRL
jgi:hypothetical protein